MITRILSILFFVVLSLSANAQRYGYSFEGALDNEQKEALETSVTKLNSVKYCKIRLKEEVSKGQLIFELDPSKVKEESGEESTIQLIKKLVINQGLSPIQLTEIH